MIVYGRASCHGAALLVFPVGSLRDYDRAFNSKDVEALAAFYARNVTVYEEGTDSHDWASRREPRRAKSSPASARAPRRGDRPAPASGEMGFRRGPSGWVLEDHRFVESR